MRPFVLFVSISLLLAGARGSEAREEPASVEREPSKRGKRDRSDEFERSFARGVELYEQGRYSLSIEEFERAYQIKNLPRVLYNMARAHFKLGHSREALALYERFLSTDAAPPLEQKQQAEEDMRTARRLIEAEEQIQAGTPALRADGAGTAADAQLTTPPRDVQPQTPIVKRWWFWTILGGAAAAGVAAGVGGYFATRPVAPIERIPAGVSVYQPTFN